MEKENRLGKKYDRSQGELKNLWTCQKLIREWEGHCDWSAYDMLPIIYTGLHTGKRFNPEDARAPKLAEVVRNSQSYIEGNTKTRLPDAEDVYMLTSKFTHDLDNILQKTPKKPEEAIHEASWALYVFLRLHPFPDGNGRVGRMLAKLIIKKGGLRDPLFHDQRWYGGGRSDYIDALRAVDETNNLAYMELFFARSLIDMYKPIKDFSKYRALSRFISQKERELGKSQDRKISDIWEGFSNVPLSKPI